MTNNIHEDAAGNKSSKRVYGAFLLIQGSIMQITIFILGLSQKSLPNIEIALDVAKISIYAGAALLGFGVFEAVGKSINHHIHGK